MQHYVEEPTHALSVKPDHIRVYEAIETFAVEHGFMPLNSEIAPILAFTISKVARLTKELVLLGSLGRRPRAPRGLTLLSHPREITAKANNLSV